MEFVFENISNSILANMLSNIRNRFYKEMEQVKKFKVAKKYRKNSLSFKDGGVTVFVQYKSGVIKEYDNIHYPDKFIGSIAESEDPNIVNIWWEETK